MDKLDALGNPIIIGNWYGFSQKDSGWTIVTFGIAEKTTPARVTLGCVRSQKYLYGDINGPMKHSTHQSHVSSQLLFPIPAQEI